MKLPVLFFQLVGSLFFINGFNPVWAFFVPANNLEMFRGQGRSNIYFTGFEQFSFLLDFISPFGLLGLIIASLVSYWVCKRRNYRKLHVLAVFVLAFLLNRIFIGDLQFFNYNSELFKAVSMHIYFLVHMLLALLIGLAFLLFPLWLRYFRYANPGGVA
ncbi:MAG TPA: hypothetical protein VD794_12650 [Flavisolibacter sp.]|nr:hypothetical protein [Flavisolibacter sp.]